MARQPWLTRIGSRISLTQGFLDIPILKAIITDTHFARRDRMGRLLVFLARLNEPDGKALPGNVPTIHGIGVEERAAVLVEPDGKARVVGYGDAYFIDARGADGRFATRQATHLRSIRSAEGGARRQLLSQELGGRLNQLQDLR